MGFLAGAGLVAGASQGGGENTAAAPAKPAAEVVRVVIRNVQFSPLTLQIKAGTTVEWQNDDLVAHTATAPAFDSGTILPGQSWRHTFQKAGIFAYVCTFHPGMTGTVVVD